MRKIQHKHHTNRRNNSYRNKPQILLSEVTNKIEKVILQLEEVEFAAITGSLAERGVSFHDIDIAVKIGEAQDEYAVMFELVQKIS